MRTDEFDYDLPPELIAQTPTVRGESRLLILHRERGEIEHRRFSDLPNFLSPADRLVLNDTRVFAARLYGRRSGQGSRAMSRDNLGSPEFLRGKIEVLLTRQVREDPNEWECLVKPGRKIGVGEKLYFDGPDLESSSICLEAEVLERAEFGERRIRFTAVECRPGGPLIAMV